MHILAGIISVIAILAVLQDSFETIILPRRVARKFRLARLFYSGSWLVWSAIAKKINSSNRREYFLSFYGPLSLIWLLALWAGILVASFAILQWAFESVLKAPEVVSTFGTYLYMSGTTFFTLGYGDVVPLTAPGRICAVLEAGLGFAFLAIIIGYVPVIYQAFSRREANITLLDARAGSPPSASEFLRRHVRDHQTNELIEFLQGWEHWASEFLEAHISYPVLAYYRSQHDRLSWLATLTVLLDICALLMTNIEGVSSRTAKFTFALARHAVVDIAQIYDAAPIPPPSERLSTEDFHRLIILMETLGLHFADEQLAEIRLSQLRNMYEPYVNALSHYFLLPLPEWVPTEETIDDWQTSAWDHFALTTQRPVARL
ncbi:hypothetical protein KSF_041200 [Reticulibacter mediterranei]|uniref:Potassium channel domain-containing protein n=1 Tax=Reticulibacter mediterranei TaxID=2778369 RepID=A0A8J3N1H3_9CHLR|nr:potassium channel family protein [Reticulibacter mediterranei]GHO94072.1 hypothetical protein KSF_041200 [Reticulibacter mediterranei]